MASKFKNTTNLMTHFCPQQQTRCNDLVDSHTDIHAQTHCEPVLLILKTRAVEI